MFGLQHFRPERASAQPRVTRVYSPPYPRPRTETYQKVFSPEPFDRGDSFSLTTSEFINKLQGEVQRLSPTFAFTYQVETPLAQALSFITQSIDEILMMKPDPDPKLSLSIEKEASKAKEELEKAKLTNKNLLKYEKILKKKAEKIAKETIENNLNKKRIQDQELQLQGQKHLIETQEKNFSEFAKSEKERLRSLQESLERKRTELNDLQEELDKKVKDSSTRIKYERTSLESLEKHLSQSKAQLVEDQKSLTNEKIRLERLKLELERQQKSLNEAREGLTLNKATMETELKTIQYEKAKLLNLKQELNEQLVEIDQAKESLDNLKQTQKSPNRSTRGLEDKTFEFSGDLESEIKMQELTEKEIQIEQEYQRIQYHIENTSRALDERQSFLEDKEENLSKAEIALKSKFENIRKIETSLTEAKIEMEELKTNTLPELESQSDVLGTLVREIQSKKHELEMSILKLSKEIEFVQKYKKKLDCENEIREKLLNSIQESPNDELKEIIEELEGKMMKILKREEELDEEEKRIETEKLQMVQTAELLRKAHKDLQRMKEINEKQNSEERCRIDQLRREVESRS